VHASFWFGIEQCSNRRWNLVPDEYGPVFAFCTTYVAETGARKKWSRFMAPVYGACVIRISLYMYTPTVKDRVT